MGSHESYSDPPVKHFFTTNKRVSTSITGGEPSKRPCTGSAPVGVSPGKRIDLRGKCIDQMSKWHELFQAGAIPQSEHDKLRGNILDDIKQF